MESAGAGEFLVRRAGAADAEAAFAVWQESAELLARADRRYALAPDSAERWQAAFAGWLARPDVAVLLAERTRKPAKVYGYIVGSLVESAPGLAGGRYGYVSELAIDSHGKPGAGRALFEALKDWFREQGAQHIEARVPARQPLAQAFWLAMGGTPFYEQMWVKLDRT
jgi:GNAT superfamily N-acetyltransferase